MALDKNKAIASAQKYLQRGQIDKAIKEYESIVDADPGDVRVWLKIGDLHSRNGKVALAVNTYKKVAETYRGKGFFLKAVAVYKKVLDVDPTLTEVYRTLGDVYIKLNLPSEALAQYRLVVGSYERDGRSADAMILLEHMVELVPEDESNHLRLAEAHAKNCNDQPAIEHFEFVLGRMRSQNRHAEFIKVAERLLYLYPEQIASGRHLAQAYLATSNSKRALAWLQRLFKLDPTDTRTLALLAETFREIGRNEKAAAVYRELVRIYSQNGETNKQQQALQRLVDVAPNDSAARDALAHISSENEGYTAGQSSILGTDANFEPVLSTEERVNLCLADVDLLLKYQLPDHARQRIDVAIGLDSKNPAVYLKLKDLCLLRNESDAAAEALVKAAQLSSEADSSRAESYLREALSLAPEHALASELLSGIGQVGGPSADLDNSELTSSAAPPMDAAEPSEDLSMDFDIDLNLDDLSLDDFSDLSDDSSEFELSLDGFELEELGFEVQSDGLAEAPDDDEFADLLADDGAEDMLLDDSSMHGPNAGAIITPPMPNERTTDDGPKSSQTLIPNYEPDVLSETATQTADFGDGFGDGLLDITMDHAIPDIDLKQDDATSEHDVLDLSEFDDLDDINQAALDVLADSDLSGDFGDLLVDTPNTELPTAQPIRTGDVPKSGDDH
ncbi:MAG: tetratricopeptide repeat protein [Myxococcota bacterium]|nr:tetratricopeptide repeat protein [Myxococcota bacterium]